VKANGACPTDGRMILGLLRRAHRASQKLDDFGLLKVIDEVGATGVPIGANAVELALELTHEQDLRDLITLGTISGV